MITTLISSISLTFFSRCEDTAFVSTMVHDHTSLMKSFFVGSFEYSFSHFDLETEIFYGNVKKAKLSKSNWIKKSSYSSSRMPTVMKKIVDIAV